MDFFTKSYGGRGRKEWGKRQHLIVLNGTIKVGNKSSLNDSSSFAAAPSRGSGSFSPF